MAPSPPTSGAALRDIAGGFTAAPADDAGAEVPVGDPEPAPRNVEELMAALARSRQSISVRRVAPAATSPTCPDPTASARAGCGWSAATTRRTPPRWWARIERAVAQEPAPSRRVMLVGSAQGGVTAAEVAATVRSDAFVVDQVVTAGAPSVAGAT